MGGIGEPDLSGVLSMFGRASKGAVVLIDPDNQVSSSTTGLRIFAPTTVSASAGTITFYNWFFLYIDGGSWTIDSGQGTATCTPKVTGVLSGFSASATLACAVTIDGVNYIATGYLEHNRF